MRLIRLARPTLEKGYACRDSNLRKRALERAQTARATKIGENFGGLRQLAGLGARQLVEAADAAGFQLGGRARQDVGDGRQ